MSSRPTSDDQATADRELCGLVNALAHQIETHVRDRAGTIGLTPAQAVALRELTGPMTMRDLAERMSCEPSNATFIIDRLEEKGLVERQTTPRDRRVKQIVLTADGVQVRERLLALLIQGSPLQPLTQQEQQTLHQLLARAVTGQ
nr:MarR family transcriptional regulator [Kibdelosporangium sp. MJ126-NF4]CEL20784.1 Transcriptional regulator, MarR family [Kibdelosporangium sp. MJ126-NF4]CTQ98412.1 Transcriptional regulator, MarR family [Kibdelosporangium sp. MJ126-NF4]